MNSEYNKLHLVIIPLMAQGHLIPMVDTARLFSQRGVNTTIVTTPLNANRFETIIDRDKESGLSIQILQVQFPCIEMGLPEGLENLDSAPSRQLMRNFLLATYMWAKPLEQALQALAHPPSCIISDKYLPWTAETARRLKIPRFVFHGTGCFSLLCSHNIVLYGSHQNLTSDSEPFTIPGIPQSIEITKAQLPGALVPAPDIEDIRSHIRETELTAHGVVVNSSDDLESSWMHGYQDAIQKKVWCIGPVSQCNSRALDKFERGNIASITKNECSSWLDLQKPNSVIYVCLGSQCRLIPPQLIQLGKGLEASNRPFIWVIKRNENFWELDKWLTGGFEEKTRGRGLLIKGWAPQAFILSHPAIGGFLTHCGWNSTLEGICAGITVGIDVSVRWGDEEKVGVQVKREQIKNAIDRLMDQENEGLRKKARQLGEVARKSMERGSSHVNMTLLIQDIMQQVRNKQSDEQNNVGV